MLRHTKADQVIKRVHLWSTDLSPNDLVYRDTNIDIEKFVFPMLAPGERVVIALDDAQRKYGETHNDFWHMLLRFITEQSATGSCFIISATDSVRSGFGSDSPSSFNALKRFDRDDMLLKSAEVDMLYDSIIMTGLSSVGFPLVKALVIGQACGHVGVITGSVLYLNDMFKQSDQRPEQALVIERIMSQRLVTTLIRCFGVVTPADLNDTIIARLQLLMFNDPSVNAGLQSSDPVCAKLTRWGILKPVVENEPCGVIFASPMAKRFVLKTYPHRGTRAPEDLIDLLTQTLSNIPAHLLRCCATSHNRFPVETTWQHVFMGGLARSLPVDYAIVPELSAIFPLVDEPDHGSSDGNIDGSIDFYINSGRRWGIELLINDKNTGEHLGRFLPGRKYQPLDLKDSVLSTYAAASRTWYNPTHTA